MQERGSISCNVQCSRGRGGSHRVLGLLQPLEASGLLGSPSRGDCDSKEGDAYLCNINFQKADSTTLLKPLC